MKFNQQIEMHSKMKKKLTLERENKIKVVKFYKSAECFLDQQGDIAQW